MAHEATHCCYCGAARRDQDALLCRACDVIADGTDPVETTKRRVAAARYADAARAAGYPTPTPTGHSISDAYLKHVIPFPTWRWGWALKLLLSADPGTVHLDRSALRPALEHDHVEVRELAIQALAALQRVEG